MTKNWFALTGLVLVLSSASLHADSYLEFKGPMGGTPAKSWTSGKMLREEATMPMIGQQIHITRVDKGVVWTLNPKKKTYTEEPIALPYTPLPQDGDSSGDGPSTGADESGDGPNCTPEIKKVPEARTIAGFQASGNRMGCKESPNEGMTVWMTSLTGVPAKVQAEQKAYSAAYAKALYANYPPKEREEMEKGMSFLKSMLEDLPKMMGAGKWPEGFVLAMEGKSDDGPMTFFEAVKLSVDPIDKSLFEIPAGYKKTAANGPAGFDLKSMMDQLKDFNNEK